MGKNKKAWYFIEVSYFKDTDYDTIIHRYILSSRIEMTNTGLYVTENNYKMMDSFRKCTRSHLNVYHNIGRIIYPVHTDFISLKGLILSIFDRRCTIISRGRMNAYLLSEG